MRASAAALAVLALGACTIFNAPDRSKIDADGGMRDGGPRDAQLRDGERRDGDICPTDVELCEGGMDEDCDSLIDCADFDCAAATDCCDRGADLRRAWNMTELMAWAQRPGGSVETESEVIVAFTGSVAMVRRDCEPLAAGRDLRFNFQAGAATCDTGTPADCFARVLLTPAASAGTTGSIVDQLAVSLDGTGTLRITRAGAELNVQTLERATHTIRIEVGSGIDDLGQSVLVASVFVDDVPAIDRSPFVQQSFLRRATACESVPGLRIGVEGRGAMVQLGPLTLTDVECVNPSQFRSPTSNGATLSHGGGPSSQSLDWGAWAQGGIAAPALVPIPNSGGVGVDDWHVLADGSDYDRSLDPIVRELGFAIGHSRADAVEWDDVWVSDDAQRIGACNPTCLASTCTDRPCGGNLNGSVREPSAFPLPGAELAVAHARRVGDGPVYGLEVGRMSASPTGGLPTVFQLLPADPCISLRDPAIVGVDPGGGGGFWVFHTCERSEMPASIWAVRVDEGLTSEVAGTRTAVLTPADGAARLWSPEVVVDYVGSGSEARHIFRLWYLTKRSTGSSPELSLAEGQLTGADVAASRLPTMTPYAANPVFGIEHTMFQMCRPDCVFLGAAAARIPGEPYIRFLMARGMNEGDVDDYQLVPLEQFWTLPE